ncbi:unnamed protein product [Auanema sp. JU1783]|nr:unnamed protein product [Auanema sp. JU1783]
MIMMDFYFWMHMPFVLVLLAALAFHVTYLRQYLRSKDFRNQFNNLCCFRSMTCCVCLTAALYSYIEPFYFDQIIKDITVQIIYTSSRYFVYSEVLFALNRVIAIIFWNYYDRIFSERYQLFLGLGPMFPAVIEKILKLTVTRCIMNILPNMTYDYVENKRFCRRYDTYSSLYLVIPIIAITTALNLWTLVWVLKFWKNKATSPNVSVMRTNIRMYSYSFCQGIISLALVFHWLFLLWYPQHVLSKALALLPAVEIRTFIEGFFLVFLNWKAIRTTLSQDYSCLRSLRTVGSGSDTRI